MSLSSFKKKKTSLLYCFVYLFDSFSEHYERYISRNIILQQENNNHKAREA